MRALCFLSAFHVEQGAAEVQNPDGTLPPSPPSGKTGEQWPLHLIPEAFADFLVYLQQQQHQFLYCRMETLVFLSLITLLPRFYLFRAQGLWDKDLFLLHAATGSLRVACLSNSGLSSATVITFS